MSMPPNPKKIFGLAKPSMQFVPPLALLQLSVAMGEGAEKYGPFNWREAPVEAGTYYSAAMRHWMLYASGETHDPKTGVHHLAYAMACAAIVLDAEAHETLLRDLVASPVVPVLMGHYTKETPAEPAPEPQYERQVGFTLPRNFNTLPSADDAQFDELVQAAAGLGPHGR